MGSTNDFNEEYFWLIKHQKKQKYCGSPRRKGRTLRSSNRNWQHQEVVTKYVRTSKEWDRKRIEAYCDNVADGLVNKSERDAGQGNRTAPANVKQFGSEVIQYSMGKQKRWTLANTLKQAMVAQVFEKDVEAPNLVIVNRSIPYFHGINRRPDVTDVTFTSLCKTSANTQDERVVMSTAGSSKFSFTSDLLRRPKTQRQRHGQSSNITDENRDPNQEMPEVLYEFAYDCPKDSYSKEPNTEGCKTNYCRKKMRKRHGFLDDYEEYNEEDYSFYSDEEENQDSEAVASGGARESPKFDLNDLLTNRLQRNQLHNKKNKSSSESARKNPDSVNGTQQKNRTLQVTEDFKFSAERQLLCDQIEKITGEVEKEDYSVELKLSKEKLERFISIYSNSEHRATKKKNSSFKIFFAYTSPVRFIVEYDSVSLVFLTSIDENVMDLADDGSQLSIVLLKIHGNNENLNQKIHKEMSELAEYDSMEEILQRGEKMCVNYGMEHFNRSSLLPNKSSAIQNFSKRGVSHSMLGLSATLGCDQQSYTPDEAMREIMDYQIHIAEENLDDFLHVDDYNAKECNCCHSDTTAQKFSGFSLKGCRHWHCEGCWRNRVITKMLQDEKETINCAQEDCTETLDSVAVKSLLSASVHQKYMQQVLGQSKMFYPCPNKLCNLLTKITMPDAVSDGNCVLTSMLTCICGESWCARCGGKSHWPASCSSNIFYQTETEILRGNLSTCIQGKSCPSCHILTQKIEGCNSVVCPCGCSYCYGCLATDCSDRGNCHKAPLQTILVPVEINGIVMNPMEMRENGMTREKHRDALFSKKYRTEVQVKAQILLEKTTARDEMEENCTKLENVGDKQRIIENLLSVKDQLHFVILHAGAEIRYGSKRRKSQHQVKSIFRKMDLLSSNIEMILFKDNATLDRDPLLSCQTHMQNGRKFIRQLAHYLGHN